MSDPLEPQRILNRLQTLLPRSTSSPLPHPTDAIAALVHAIHTSLLFRVVAPALVLSDEGLQQHNNSMDDGASETSTAVEPEGQETGDVENRLWTGWNHRAEDSYGFEYKHPQSSLTFRVRVGRMGGRVQIDATAEVRTYPAMITRETAIDSSN